MAQITLTFPGLEAWNVEPATVEVPIEEGRWWAWLQDYGPLGAGAMLAAGIAWIAARWLAKLVRRR